jgi:hypothetical protein
MQPNLQVLLQTVAVECTIQCWAGASKLQALLAGSPSFMVSCIVGVCSCPARLSAQLFVPLFFPTLMKWHVVSVKKKDLQLSRIIRQNQHVYMLNMTIILNPKNIQESQDFE